MALGDRMRARERFEAALDAYGHAVDLDPDRSDAHAGRGLALLDLGKKPQAEAAFQTALLLDPRNLDAVMGLAETYRSLGRNPDALKYYRRYLELAPNGPEAAVARSAIEKLSGE